MNTPTKEELDEAIRYFAKRYEQAPMNVDRYRLAFSILTKYRDGELVEKGYPILSSKDHEQPFYFDGKNYISFDGMLKFKKSEFRSDGDYFTISTFVSPPTNQTEK